MSNKINEMIDKAIGKDGPLRIGAYWLNKILKDILAKIKSTEERTVKIEENKADKMTVESSTPLSVFQTISPNIYYKLTPTTDSLYITLNNITATHYKEYIIEITCTQYAPKLYFYINGGRDPYPISWANGIAPELGLGSTYLISISNGLGIFSAFPNQ